MGGGFNMGALEDTPSITLLSFIVIIGFVISFDFFTGYLEFILEDSPRYNRMVQHIYKELMQMGIISFLFVLGTNASGDKKNPWIYALDFTHILLFYLAIFFVVHTFFLIFTSMSTANNYARLSAENTYELLTRKSQMSQFEFFKFNLNFISISRDREIFEFKLLHILFKETFARLPDNFSFHLYLSKSFEQYSLKIMDFGVFSWVVILFVAFANFIRTQINGTVDCKYEAYRCGGIITSLLIILAILVSLYIFIVVIVSRIYEIKLLKYVGVNSTREYDDFLNFALKEIKNMQQHSEAKGFAIQKFSIESLKQTVDDFVDAKENNEEYHLYRNISNYLEKFSTYYNDIGYKIQMWYRLQLRKKISIEHVNENDRRGSLLDKAPDEEQMAGILPESEGKISGKSSKSGKSNKSDGTATKRLSGSKKIMWGSNLFSTKKRISKANEFLLSSKNNSSKNLMEFQNERQRIQASLQMRPELAKQNNGQSVSESMAKQALSRKNSSVSDTARKMNDSMFRENLFEKYVKRKELHHSWWVQFFNRMGIPLCCNSISSGDFNLRTDFDEIFLFSNPKLFFRVVEVALMVNSFFFALCTYFMIPLSHYGSNLWYLTIIIPLLITFPCIAKIIRTASLIQAVTELQLEVIRDVLTESEDMRILKEELRDTITNRLGAIYQKSIQPVKNKKEANAADALKQDIVHRLFKEVDVDGNGIIDKVEFRNLLTILDLHYSDKRFQRLFKAVDVKVTGKIGIAELEQLIFPHDENNNNRNKRKSKANTSVVKEDNYETPESNTPEGKETSVRKMSVTSPSSKFPSSSIMAPSSKISPFNMLSKRIPSSLFQERSNLGHMNTLKQLSSKNELDNESDEDDSQV